MEGEKQNNGVQYTIRAGKKMEGAYQQLLRYSIDGSRIAAEHSNELLLEYDLEEDSIIHLTSRISRVFGLPVRIDHPRDYMVRTGIIRPEYAREFREMFDRIHRGRSRAECIVRARSAQGELLWIQIVLSNCFDKTGKPTRANGVLRDITAQREAELRRADDALHRKILMRESLIYYEADLTARKMLFGTDFLYRLSGNKNVVNYDEAIELLIGNIVYPDEREQVRQILNAEALLRNAAEGKELIELEYRRLLGNGMLTWVKGSVYLHQDPLTQHVLLYFYVNDIGDIKLKETPLQERTERDPLTGLYNRVAVELQIQKALEQAKPDEGMAALMLVSLPDFPKVKQSMGSYFADALISELGYQLQTSRNEADIIGRTQSNEFLFYLPNLVDRQDAENSAQEIYRIFCHDRVESLEECAFDVSVGVALFPKHGSSFATLLKRAKLALSDGGETGGVCFYHAGMHKPAILMEQERDPNQTGLEKSFADHMMEYIFHILYESKNLDAAMFGVLEMVAKHFGFGRAFLYEKSPDGGCRCSFQWVQPDFAPLSEQECSLDATYFSALQRLFGSDNVFMYEPERKREDGLVYSMLFAFRNAAAIQGFVGFDLFGDAAGKAVEMDRRALQSMAQVMEVFQSGRATNNDLMESTLLLQCLVDGYRSCTYIIDPETFVLKYVNQNTRQVIPEAVPGTYCFEMIRGRKEPCADCPITRMKEGGVTEDRSEMYLDRYDVWAKINANLIKTREGKAFGVFHGFDFSQNRSWDEVQAQGLRGFMNDTSLYDALAMSTDDFIFMCDMSTQLFYFPRKMAEDFDLPGQIVANAVQIWGERVHEDDREDFLAEMNGVFAGSTDTHSMEYRVLNKDGIWVWVRARGHIERNESGVPTMFAGVLTNLGAKKSKIDHLTGLQDKYEFELHVRAQLGSVAKGALLILGLDNFRHINNIYGWEFGDNVLRESAQRLAAVLPERVQLYRLDGDKFGIFFAETTRESVEEYYRALLKAFRQHRQLGEHKYFCTISGGCVCLDTEAVTLDILLKRAAYALDYSKGEGKNRLTFYDEKKMGGNDRVLKLMACLHDSIESNFENFALYFQPQLKPQGFEVKSAEALLRWNCPEIGAVSPAEFIPILEQTGLIHKVGRWVMEQATTVCHEWRKWCPEFTISVNLSFAQLQDQKFMPYLTSAVNRGSIDPKALHLEITESCIAGGSKSLIEAFRVMREMGFKIEMDDFGTGYSSLEILKNAPTDVVKIDSAFVKDILQSNFDATFIQFVVMLCHSVNIKVCLEGVESWDEYFLVEPMQLDLIQGFLFGRPQPKEEFESGYLDPAHAMDRLKPKQWMQSVWKQA